MREQVAYVVAILQYHTAGARRFSDGEISGTNMLQL